MRTVQSGRNHVPDARDNVLDSQVGKCRNDRDYCEDCMITNISDIYSVHYNMCRKPWNCIGEGTRANKAESSIPEDQVNLEHCMELLTMWHTVRTDLETRLFKLVGNATIENARNGDYRKEVFQGHCTGYGGENYLALVASEEMVRGIGDLYNQQ
jgi:hypothetical protein